jgi:hypothetical protein
MWQAVINLSVSSFNSAELILGTSFPLAGMKAP